jgi:hypothetical protein
MYLLSSGLALGIWYLCTSIKPHQEQWNIVKYILSTVYHGLIWLHFFFFWFIYNTPIGPSLSSTAFYCDLTRTWPQDHSTWRFS